VCFLLVGLIALVVGCNSDSNDWTWYDAEYVGAQSNIPGLQGQGNHYGWDDPQPDHGNDDKGHKPKKHDDGEEYFDLPAYFILRHHGLETLYVNADDLMAVRPGLTEEGGLVAIHVFDCENPELLWYPDHLFGMFGNLVVENYLDWIADD
jgi:hypothetical protein